jgi:hypothetical protein
MKASSQTSGKSIVCPQCLKKIVVPKESDPKAEQLYYHTKQKKSDNTAKNSNSQQTLNQTHPQSTELNEIDKWIDDFWIPLPKDNIPSKKPSALPNLNNNREISADNARTQTQTQTQNQNQNQNQLVSKRSLLHNNKYLFAVILLVFLISFFAGFIFNELWRIRYSKHDINNKKEISDKENIHVEGKLSYRNEFGVKRPDVDATILFLPTEARNTIPISIDGLRTDNGIFDPNNDNVQRIIELGGAVQRTDANGKFAFPLKTSGDYIAIMISSNVQRTTVTQLSPEIINYLKKFFKNPEKLIDKFRVEKEEYNINKGTQIIHKTFE